MLSGHYFFLQGAPLTLWNVTDVTNLRFCIRDYLKQGTEKGITMAGVRTAVQNAGAGYQYLLEKYTERKIVTKTRGEVRKIVNAAK